MALLIMRKYDSEKTMILNWYSYSIVYIFLKFLKKLKLVKLHFQNKLMFYNELN